MAPLRSEFRNTRDYNIGVVTRRADQKMKAQTLRPGEKVWLDEEEQIETANAPREEKDNPFTNGDLELVTPAQEVVNRRPIGDTAHRQVTDVERPEAADEPPLAEDGESDPEAPSGAAGEGSDAEGSEEPQETPEEATEADGEAEAAQGDAEEPGRRKLTKEEQEESAREAAAAAVGQPAPPSPQSPEETGAAKPPTGEPPVGQRAATEEVGTPEATQKD